MTQIRCRQLLGSIVLLVAFILSGCATVGDQRVDILYKSDVTNRIGSGDLYIMQQVPAPSGGQTRIQWVVGGISNNDGENIGNIVTDTAPVDILTDAFVQDMKASGYNVLPVNSMPVDAKKGLILKSVTIKMDEKKSLVKSDAKCAIKLSVEPWLNGKALNRIDYEAEYADSDVVGREEILSKTMLKAVEMLMTQSVREISRMLEQK